MTISSQEAEKLHGAIGPGAERYLERFAKIDATGEEWAPGWNWPAFFCSSGWFAYRRMGLYSLLNFLLPVACVFLLYALIETALGFLVVLAYFAVAYIAIPAFADAAYFRFLKKRLARAGAAEDAKQAAKLLRPPSVVTAIEGFLTGGLSLVFALALLLGPAMYADFGPRAQVSEGMSRAGGMAAEINEFYRSNGRLPTAGEAEPFRRDGNKFIRSIVYDPEKRVIVVTMEASRLKGKRFAMRFEDKGGTPSWTCRSVDIDRQHMPSACRE